MKRRLLAVVFALLFCTFMMFSAAAADGLPRLVDEAGLLSDSEEMDLTDKLDEISERQQVDIVIVTVYSLEGEDVGVYADDFYDYNGYGYGNERDGILFLISMDERDWYISTRGYGITAVTDAGLEYMSGMFLDDLSDGDYAAAFTVFAELCDDFIEEARIGEPYDIDHLPKEPFGGGWKFAAAMGIGFLISLIVTGTMRSELKTVRGKTEAEHYVMGGSVRLTKKKDLFLYRTVDRREKPKDDRSGKSGGSETHTSSSGATHGGGGGKF